MTEAAPKTCHPFSVPARVAGPNRAITPTTPRLIALS